MWMVLIFEKNNLYYFVSLETFIWQVVVKPVYANGTYEITATSKWHGVQVSIKLDNILFGDVWLCGGQSNMVFTIGMVINIFTFV